MTVKEVFELRKQGKTEEAYATIRPMYAVHKGKYTTLCMFWTASDILKIRVKEGRIDEAVKIFKALIRILPNIDDPDGKAISTIYHEAVILAKEARDFSMLDFVGQLKAEDLNEEDWKTGTMPATPDTPAHPIPSLAQQMLTCAFREIRHNPTVDNALKVMPLLQEGVNRRPHDKNIQRHMAVVYRIMGEEEKARAIYRRLLVRCHDSFLYAELAELTHGAPGHKAALYCRAILNQKQEKFRTGYRLELARLLLDRDKAKALHELQKCVDTRKALGLFATTEMQAMMQQLHGTTPSSDAEQQAFYKKMTERFPVS